MKKLLFTVLILSLQLVSAQQASSVSQKGMESYFSAAAISAYQQSSQSKVADFYQYLEIFSDKSAPENLRKQARETIYSLFENKNTAVTDFTSEKSGKITLESLLSKMENSSLRFTVQNQPSNTKTAAGYWLNDYLLEIKSGSQARTILIRQKIYFFPVFKKFGADQKQVWTLQLGEMQ